MTPILSIITRTADRPACLERMLPHLARAAPEQAEWILCDDAPEGSPRLAAFVERARSTLPFPVSVVESRSASRPHAANAGLAAAQGRYVHLHDDDDTVLPEFYRRTIAFLEARQDFGGVATRCDRIDETIRSDGTFRTRAHRPHYPSVGQITLIGLATTQTISPIAFVARRAAMTEVGTFNEELLVCEDHEYFLRFLLKYDIGVIGESLARFHVRTEQAGSYGNSDASLRHQEADARFRNAMLRRDLREGSLGVGALLALGEIARPGWRIDTLLNRIRPRAVSSRLHAWFRR